MERKRFLKRVFLKIRKWIDKRLTMIVAEEGWVTFEDTDRLLKEIDKEYAKLKQE